MCVNQRLYHELHNTILTRVQIRESNEELLPQPWPARCDVAFLSLRVRSLSTNSSSNRIGLYYRRHTACPYSRLVPRLLMAGWEDAVARLPTSRARFLSLKLTCDRSTDKSTFALSIQKGSMHVKLETVGRSGWLDGFDTPAVLAPRQGR